MNASAKEPLTGELQREHAARAAHAYTAAADHYLLPALGFWDRWGVATVARLPLSSGDVVLDVCCGAEESESDVLAAEHLRELQKQRARSARRVVDLVHLGLTDDCDPGEELRHLLRCEELAAGLAGVGGVHGHQVLVGVAEGVDGVVGVLEVEVADRVEQLDELLVPLRDSRPELVGVDVEVVDQSLDVVLARRANG